MCLDFYNIWYIFSNQFWVGYNIVSFNCIVFVYVYIVISNDLFNDEVIYFSQLKFRFMRVDSCDLCCGFFDNIIFFLNVS